MTTLFSDDFESGNLSAWTGTNGSITVDMAAAYQGTYGCDANTIDQFAYKDFTAPASKIVTHGAYVKLVSASGTGQARVLQINEGTKTRVRLYYDNSSYVLLIKWSDDSEHTVALSPQPTTGTWYHIQMVYDWSGVAPVATCYIDGVSVATLTDGNFILPVSGNRVFLLAFVDTGSVTAQTYFDNVLVEDALPSNAITGNASITQAAETISTAGGVLVSADASISQADQTISADGSIVTGDVIGNLDLTQDIQTLLSAGGVLIVGNLSKTQAGNTVFSSDVSPVIGAATATVQQIAATATVALSARPIATISVP